ncbi:SDR family oxidoreductase [bacterium]|jgi:3-oxoacyl-[acyl-carrier protein] reductase|nr:SDR family oxidoreductase [bacterium]MBT3850488.1 SDR family oxidoreductase [bacterium]MBT4435805.1 SDR family oxidoreductase [bacterium]MDG2446130.1 SDR family oxidoreductase [Thermodesulfobacteriota bacterium]|tara:strand:- start:1415 stop:2209 length:795 start_codon:yes stop_codon:yes gene_type:complete
MDLGLDNKFAIVCASSKGLGFAVAKSLVDEGCEVVISSSSEANLKNAEEKLDREKPKGSYHLIQADLSNDDGIKTLYDFSISKSKRIDILINNCGGPDPGNFSKVNQKQLDLAINKNLKNVFALTKLVLPIMKSNNWGRIVNITSSSAKQPIENLILSNITRAAVSAFSKSISTEYAKFNIMVNNVLPGRILTDRIINIAKTKSEESGISQDEILKALGDDLPIGRIGKPEELSSLVAFLCSEKASYITGNSINIDGGLIKSLF